MTKIIRDSVHGNIVVDNVLVTTIIDTPIFQRLRRIEQTAIRSIYPSARHDRFIHSLGVYFIGKMIVDHLSQEMNIEEYGLSKDVFQCICTSYLVACLLHDIAHAPFSHTFEKYYGSKSTLYERLNDNLGKCLDKENFKIDKPNYHEYASAIVCIEEFNDSINTLNADVELVCRMIIGCFYNSNKDAHLIHNCFISLLHGDIIDADRLDYACRDVWASGYSTSTIDIERIANSIHIEKNETGEPVVCIDSNSLNEVDNMLSVRQFQNRYVINHHSVQYEQKLMVLAAEYAAHLIFPDLKQEEALMKIINIDNTVGEKLIGENLYINRLSDEDLLSLMKQSNDNKYYKEFSSRQYERFAIWKTPDEFFNYFPWISHSASLYRPNFEQLIQNALKDYCDVNDILFSKVTYKPSTNLEKLYVKVKDRVVRYPMVHFSMMPNMEMEDIDFYYVYVKKNDVQEDLDQERNRIVQILTPIMKQLYPLSTTSFRHFENIITELEYLYRENNSPKYEQRTKQLQFVLSNTKNVFDFLTQSGIEKYLESIEK